MEDTLLDSLRACALDLLDVNAGHINNRDTLNIAGLLATAPSYRTAATTMHTIASLARALTCEDINSIRSEFEQAARHATQVAELEDALVRMLRAHQAPPPLPSAPSKSIIALHTIRSLSAVTAKGLAALRLASRRSNRVQPSPMPTCSTCRPGYRCRTCQDIFAEEQL
eukprot:m.17432 g.17432  ORF g.17432 m.17432 type:complete len:169 (-) comp3246_c0_seq1:1656-2162(-)